MPGAEFRPGGDPDLLPLPSVGDGCYLVPEPPQMFCGEHSARGGRWGNGEAAVRAAVSIPGSPAHPVGVLRVGLPGAVSQNPACGRFCRPIASEWREGGGRSMAALTPVVKARVPLSSRCLERQCQHETSQVLSGHPPGWAPGDAVCYSSPRAATVSAWHLDVLRQLPRTSPGSVGMSRPQLQPSSRDPSSKSRCFACSLTGTRRVEQPPEALGAEGQGLGLGVGWQERRGWA